MRRLKNDEDGATAVVVALSLIVLFGFGALAVDVGQIYQERRELQNGADAAALAAAQDCADGDPLVFAACVVTPVADDCDVTTAPLQGRIDEYAVANANDASANVCVYELDLIGKSITVETETLSGGDNFLTHWLAGVLGHPTTTVTAQATAAWGAFGSGSTVPLTFSYCEWSDMVPTLEDLPTSSETIFFHDGKKTDPEDCVGPAGQDTAGGFGWLDTDGSGACEADVTAEAEAEGDTGNNVPKECDPDFWASLVGETVMIPIFSEITGTGAGAIYYIEGVAAFELEGYRLSGDKKYNHPDPPPCTGDERCIRGRFTDYVSYGDFVGGGVGNYGVSVVTLIE